MYSFFVAVGGGWEGGSRHDAWGVRETICSVTKQHSPDTTDEIRHKSTTSINNSKPSFGLNAIATLLPAVKSWAMR